MFLNDAFKADVLKFLASPAGTAFVEVLRQRRPNSPDGTTPHAHTLMNGYAIKEGYDIALAEIMKIPHDSAPQEPDSAVQRLLDPKD